MSETDPSESDYESEEYEESEYEATVDDTPSWAPAINVLLGLWLIVEAFWFELPVANFWNDLIIGVAVVVLAGYNYYRVSDDDPLSVGGASLVALLGLWMIVAPFVFEVPTEAAFWNDVVVGALVALIAGYSAYEARDVEAATPTERV